MTITLVSPALRAAASVSGLSTHFHMADLTTAAVDQTTHGALILALEEHPPTWDAARGEALIEVGVDIFVQVEERPGAEARSWYLPVQGLVEIYHSLGYADANVIATVASRTAQS